MHTSPQKQHQPQQKSSTNFTKSNRSAPAASHAAHPLLNLQRTIGNQAVLRLLQARADGPEARAHTEVGPTTKVRFETPTTNRFAHDFGRSPVQAPAPITIQPKLTVNTHGDSYEKEADELAEQVMRMPEPQLQRGGGCSKCRTEQPSHKHQRLQTKHVGSSNAGQTTAPPIVHEVLSSPGQPLDPTTRAFMEPRFGRDFSQVRVHADAQASESARAVNASAYTVGRDVVFGAGQYTPGTTIGRGLVAHELAHVIQQGAPGENSHPDSEIHFHRDNDFGLNQPTIAQMPASHGLNGAFLQRRLVTESAGGCGVCNEARFVGSEVHTLVQTLSFPPNVRREFPIGFDIDPTNGDMDGRLDLLEVRIDTVRRTIEAYIGEIKPNNSSGIKAGVKDLAFYKQAVHDFFKGAYPDHAVTVEFLDIDPNPAILPYVETQSCPGQAVEVENARDGLYLYNCSPLRSELDEDCCEDKEEEDEATQTAGDLAMVGSQLSSLREDKKKAHQEEQKRQMQQAPSSSSSTAERVGQLLARATTLGKIVEAHIRVYGAFATWAYTGVYEGTRGYNLKQRLSELAEQVQPLSHEVMAALTLASDLAIMEEVADSEAETAGVRVELTKYMISLGNKIFQTGRILEFARSYSAIEKRIDLREGDLYALYLERSYDLRTGLGVSLAKPSDNDAFSLSLVIEYQADVAEWLLTQIGHIFSDLEGVINDDQRAWLEFRR